MASITELAERLAENLPLILTEKHLDPADLDRIAHLPYGLTERLIVCDPAAYPCPRQWNRICLALQVSSQELLAE